MPTEEAKQEIQRLVAKYEALDSRTIKRYKEANTKDVFVQRLFEALGWDFSNFDEVEAERTITRGRVDYIFKLKNLSKFCLEIKALHVDINDERWIRQAIGYAYNKGVTWAVLTNFKTLRVFNAKGETKDINQIAFLNLTYDNYLTDFHRLWLLSRESVDGGNLDREAVAYGRLPPRLSIEKRLYTQLRNCRETLFNEIYLYYKDDKDEKLSWSQVDQLIQQLLNRLIFIRTAEDRGLIDMNLLAARHQWESSGGKTDLMEGIRDIFHEFARLYDSDLFPQIMDPWDSISVYNSRALADIIQGLYEVPGGLADWNFATIGYDVLGTVYEQYLGYVPARVEKEAKEAQQRLFPAEPHIGITAKKEKRKGAGIYYTPPWVVDYIVKQTVGRFIEEHNYNDILNIRILDPACGSGSFLTRAYEELLNYHARQQGKSPADLDQAERTRILLRNIYGVDLDQQAVEIARLSLLLCSLSGQETLPSLANNIRRGNSIISGTDEELRRYFGDNWEEKHRFNWEEEFLQIMTDGGFDVVVGNPPYGADFDENDRKYIEAYYPYSKSNKNSAMVFIERGLSLLKERGFFSYIIPKSLAFSQKWASGRELIHDKLGIACDTSKAFKKVLLEQMIVVVSQKFSHQPYYEAISFEEERAKGSVSILKKVAAITDSFPLGISDEELAIFHKVSSSGLFMKDICKTERGLPLQKYVTGDPQGIPVYRGDHIARYALHKTHETLPEEVLTRAKKKVSFLQQPKILSQRIVAHVLHPADHIILMSTFDEGGVLTLDTVENTVLTDNRFHYGFITALLNSKLWSWYAYRFIFSQAIRTMDLDDYYLRKFPLPPVDFDNPREKKMHDDLVALVDRMLELNRRLAPIRNTPCNEQDELRREIARTDDRIDNLVYDLYRLTKAEKEIVKKETEGGS